jgi:UDP-glucose:(glucosyl)LPS alpha-1,2-glucosyltransferase
VPKPVAAIVLPPREGFSAEAAGAVGLLVRRLAVQPSRYAPHVFGLATVGAPFAGIAFEPVRPTLFPGNATRRYAGGVARALRAAPPDVIEVHNRPDAALMLADRFPAVPVLLVLHNDPQGMRRARTVAERRRLLDRLAGIVAVSAWVRGRFLDGIGDDARVRVLPNCLDPAELPPAAAERDPVILFAGRVVADKGADTFVAACARALPALPGWRAEMIGADRFRADSPETSFLAALRPQAAAAGVVLHGYRPHAAVLAAMARAGIVVVPSRWPEPFGLTALEAMACGAALLYAPRGGLPEVAGEAGVAIDPDDPAALANAIVAIARDASRRAALAAAGLARAARFTAAAAAAALDALRHDARAAWPRAPGPPI